MNLLQRIDPFLQLNIIGRKLRLPTSINSRISLRSATHRITLSSDWPSLSLTYCWVRAANGVNEALFIQRLALTIANPGRGRKGAWNLFLRDVLAKGLEFGEIHIRMMVQCILFGKNVSKGKAL